jgi:GNAT superfamily N-acetyltransferase
MPDADSHARLARGADRPGVADILAEAFAADAALAHTLPPGVGRRDDRLRRFFAQEVARSVRCGGAWVTADAAGAAVWYPPNHWRPGPWESLRQAPGALRVFGRHTGRASRTSAALHEHHPTQPHWYLAYLGTRRGRQGTGVGTALLRPVLERCDRDGLPAYLEASNARNRGLYLRHGFVDREPLALPDGGPTVYPMWREP